MGSGASSVSSLHKLRKLLVIRAYNSNPNQELTLTGHFTPHAVPSSTNPDKMVITPDGICAAVGLPSLPLLDEFMDRCGDGAPGKKVTGGFMKKGEIDFEAFVGFLEKGIVPERRRKSKVKQRLHQSLSTPNIALSSSSTPTSPSTTPDRKCAQGSRPSTSQSEHLPPSHPPPSIVSPPASPTEDAPVPSVSSKPPMNFALPTPSQTKPKHDPPRILAEPNESFYPSVVNFLGFRPPVHCRDLGPINKHFGLRRFPASGRPLWKKQETIIQERIVKYVTVEPDGSFQELVETEKNQTEVTHMECKDTGEFAHKETTEYEQMETFNSEVVMAERGTEQYVHLKSKDDEYEHLESHMPRKEREREAAMKEQEEHEAMLSQMEEERELRMKMEAEMEAERIKMGGEPLPPDYASPSSTPMGFRLGDPMPPGLSEEEQVYWHAHQRALLEEQYMQQMINDNISLAGEEGGVVVEGTAGPGGPIFYDNGMGSPDPHMHGGIPLQHEPIPPYMDGAADNEELLMEDDEEMLRQREEFMRAQNIILTLPEESTPASPTTQTDYAPTSPAPASPSPAIPAPAIPTPVPNPELKGALFSSPPPKAEGEETPAKDRIFRQLDEENQHPNGEDQPTLQTPKCKPSTPGTPNAEAVFASPTPSDKAAGLD